MDEHDEDHEHDLISAAKSGDEQALEQLVRLHQGRVRAFLGVRLHDPSMVDDLAQDAFIIACRELERFDQDRPFYPWLRGIAHNVLRHHLRKRRPLGLDTQTLEGLLERSAEEQAEHLPEVDPAPALEACLDRLSGLTAATVRAFYFEGRSQTSIAEEQGRSSAAVAVMMVRARQWLRSCIESRMQIGQEC